MTFPTWTRSSYCSYDNGCVEVALPQFRTSSRCESGHYVAVAVEDTRVLVRDSKNPDQPGHTYTLSEWQKILEFLRGDAGGYLLLAFGVGLLAAAGWLISIGSIGVGAIVIVVALLNMAMIADAMFR